MAKKKTKFPLKLKNDVEVRTLDELHEHFDLEKIIGYFQDGRLLTWLNDRDYEDEANQVENLDKSDGNIGAELCRIFGVEIEKSDLSSLDAESIKVRNERIARLKQYPDGITAIDHVDCVAFNQEELNKLLDNGVSEIYLCNGKFTIPIKQKNKKYIGIGKVEVATKSKKAVDFEALGISFVNVKFDEKFALPTKPTADALLEIANEAATEEDYARAKEYWQKAAEAGNSDAMYALGNMYREGLGVKKDDKQAVEWLKKAIKNDNIAAMLNLGEMYANGEGVRKNRQQAVKLFERAATMGNTDAAYKLGYMYYKGEGVTQDFKKAKELLKKAADNGAANAMFLLGNMYVNGEGVRKNHQQAVELFERAALAGNPEAACQLGCMYYQGKGASTDYKEAAKWFEKAANNGNIPALFNLGQMYANGKGVKENVQRAIEYYEQSAAGNSPYAMEQLGLLYKDNKTVQDFNKAMKWLKKAAEKGRANAMTAIGDMYEEGLGVPKNHKQSFDWYNKGADAEDAHAMCKLGIAYCTGTGVEKDEQEGIGWIEQAADAGNEEACQLLEDFETKCATSKSNW